MYYLVKGVQMAAIAASAVPPFTAVVEAYYAPLARRLMLIVRDRQEAEDLVQATFTKAYESWPSIRQDEVGSWLFAVGTRLALNELRRRRRWLYRKLQDDDQIGGLSSDPDLWAALGELDRHERAALFLNSLAGYTQAEIAELLGVPAGTVASWLSRGKARLRARLEEKE